MSGMNSQSGPPPSYSELEGDRPAEQPVLSNGYYEKNIIADEQPNPALERECLDDYSFDAGILAATGKAEAFSVKTRSKVMMKRFSKANESEIARANREIIALQAISDPVVPGLLDYFDPAGSIFTIVDDREGESLKQYVEGRGTLSEEMLKSVITQLFSGVAQIFFYGFAHLRITNETLFIDNQGQLIIKDFEYAHPYQNEKIDDLYAIVNIPRYGADIFVAPEVFTATSYNGRKAVIWSCGVAAYYMTTGQTEKLSNLNHPAFSKAGDSSFAAPREEQPQERRRSSLGFRRQSTGGRKVSISTPPNMISYPGSRFEVTLWIRDIISKMLIVNPHKRAELIEVAAKVPKEFRSKETRPLMEVAWNDYKIHAGPHAGLHEEFELDSSASSIYSGISNFSNPFGSLLGSGRRRSSAKGPAVYSGYV